MCNYNKTQVSPYDPTKLAIYSILFPEDDLISTFGQNFKKTVSFDNNVHFLEEKIIVTYVDFDCGITLYPETPTKISRSNGERNYNSGSSKKPKCIPSNYQHIRSFDKQHISIIFLNPYNVWDMVPLDLKSLNHTNDRYFNSNQYFQPTIHQHRTHSYPSLSSLRTMDSERKGLRVSFAFLQRNFLPDGRVIETVATVEELSDLWEPGAMDRIPATVMNSNCI